MWRKTQKTLATFVPAMLLLVYLTVAICLLNRWDAMVPVTLIPVWAWAGFGMLLSLLCGIFCRGLPSLLMFCLCLATAVFFSEETIGLARELIVTIQEKQGGPPTTEASSLRVVNVNCGGAESVLRRAMESEPDILVIQEAPEKAVLQSAAEQLYGVEGFVTSHLTNAILARGELLGTLTDPESATLHARIKRSDGFTVDVTNLDLEGCAPTFDMWRPSVWKELIEARVVNRRLVRTHLGENEITKPNIGRILSGGFGTPPGDDVYRPLETNDLVDTYAAAGLGWGNTFPSEYPILRLDQIWASPNLTPIRSVTLLSSESDHRIVVSDLKVPFPHDPANTAPLSGQAPTSPVPTP